MARKDMTEPFWWLEWVVRRRDDRCRCRGWVSTEPARTVASGRRRRRAGRRRSSHRGSHQLRSPSSSMVAGTSTMRTMVASTKIAVAMPIPISLRNTWSPGTKARKTAIMIAAAAVMTRAVAARPSATARCCLRALVLLADAGQQEHLVVHGQPEEDGEHHHRDEAGTGVAAWMPISPPNQPPSAATAITP